MKRTFFSGGLYRDALRQLKAFGIVFGVISAAISVAIVIIAYYSSIDPVSGQINFARISPPSAALVAPVLLGIVFAGTLMLIFRAFSFLTSRAASDLWHSLPGTRVSTAVSLVAAALTWLYGIITVTLLLTWATYAITGLPFNALYVPYLLLGYSAAATLVAGAALVGVSVTGTAFSAFIVMGLTLYLPRFVLLIYAHIVPVVAPVVYMSDMGLLGNPAFHLPSALTFALFDRLFGMGLINTGMSELFVFKGGIAYTAALGAITLLLGVLLYRVRRSEIAGNSAPNRPMQHIFRCALTLPILLIGAGLGLARELDPSAIIVILVLSMTVYFCYELITTRKARSLLSAAPLYPAVVAATAAFALIAAGVGDRLLHAIPSPGDVKSVCINVNADYTDTPNYNELMTERIRYEDPAIAELLVDGLRKTVEHIESDYRSDYSGRSAGYRLYLNNGRAMTRKIMLPSEKLTELMALQLQYQEYRDSYRALPPDDAIMLLSADGLDKDASRRIWEVFRREADGLTDAQFAQVAGVYMPGGADLNESPTAETVSAAEYDGPHNYGRLSVTGSVGTGNFISHYMLSDLTPEASTLYIAESNRLVRDDVRLLLDYIESYDPAAAGEYDYYSIHINLIHSDVKDISGEPHYLSIHSDQSSPYAGALTAILRESLDTDPAAGQQMVHVRIYSWLDSETIYLPVSQAQAEALIDLADTLNQPAAAEAPANRG